MSDRSTSDTSATQSASASKERVRARLRESRSRLLSLLGLRAATSVSKGPPSESAPALIAEVEAPPGPPCISPSTTTGEYETAPVSPIEEDHPSSRFSFILSQQSRGQLAKGRPNSHGLKPPENNDFISSMEKRGIRSSPAGFTERVASKFSTTFGNPTVIHRSDLRSRPSVRDVHFEMPPPLSLEKQGDNANDTSDPSTPTSCSDSPKSALPSILTVEAAVNAKVFFETYFRAIYLDIDPRAQRKRELEQYMFGLPIAPDEKARIWKNWRDQEREYLRQCRVLKTPSSRGDQEGNSVIIGGFEIIKTLGRGSFGVVRLVRERGDREEASKSVTKGRPFSLTKSELAHDKGDHKQSRRRIMTGVKKDVFAMKVIRKSIMIRNCQEGHLRAERDLLVASTTSRWIVPLIASFQDTHSLYLIMDYMVGGDFLGLLLRRCVLTENIARWYVVEMILCIEEAHRLFCIHRDVKPDNFLISASGHLKISDFGLAFDGHWAHDQLYYNEHRYSLVRKLGIQVNGDRHDQIEASKETATSQNHSGEGELLHHTPTTPSTGVLGWRDQHQMRRWARSIVGTSQYMAPEVVRGELYDGRCDWWSVGIILYECLYGFTPFSSKDRQETKWKIHHHLHTLHFPIRRPSDKLISAEAIGLINHLLQEKEKRLSCEKYRSNDTFNPQLASARLFGNTNTNTRTLNSRGLYVYPDDAVDIKAHPFFRGVDWDEHHRSHPPFVPKVRSWEDTRYFDESSPIGADDMPMTSETDPSEHEASEAEAAKKDSPQPENQNQRLTPEGTTAIKITKKDLQKKERKRPRDKILRDKKLAKPVLEMRKKGAFAGYTYRRPKAVAMAFRSQQVRSYRTQGQLVELYG
ncbi:hypothetical protein FE257_007557 [Aspergillus nanangensis]|uniref:non-specific serine/threonine protein kinase n=1 Tax=Aspergillus nanangensis TaxID=2582783 RepID=A0AAD4GT78_ASPNN|nr:hypothetical protein FE257_007557 [Aspergillus nanangensis]